MKISIHLLSQSQPIIRHGIKNAYTKDGLYCILINDDTVEKYPLVNIFRILEE